MSATALRPPAAPPVRVDVSGFDGPTDLPGQIQLAEFLALAEATIPPIYRGRAADLLATIYQAQALNIPVMTALHNLHWDEETGKGALSAQLMGALLLRGGVVWEAEIDSGKRVTMRFTRLDGRPAGTCSWLISEAVTAGLVARTNWQHYPDDNLYARCLSRGARRFAPDLVLGLGYTPEELFDMQRPGERSATVDERPVAPEVVEYLAQVTEETPAAEIRKLIEKARTKKVGLAGEYAGGGLTVDEMLQAAWRAAVARESADSLAAADALAPPPGEAPADVQRPEDLSVPADATAGSGDLPCGCPAWAVLTDGIHLGTCNDPSTPRG